MSDKDRQKKNGQRKDKDRQAMKEASAPRREQASVRYGEQKRSGKDDGRRPGVRRP